MSAERSVAHYVPQWGHLPDPHRSVVRHVNGAVEGLFRADGIPFEDASNGELEGMHERMCSLLRQLSMRTKISISSFLVHREADDSDLPRMLHRSDLGRRLDAGYRRRLIAERRLYLNDLFVGALVKPAAVIDQVSLSRKVSDVASEDVRDLESALAVIHADLGHDYGLTRLGLERRGKYLYSQHAEALGLVLTGRPKPIPLPAGRLGFAICAHRPVFRSNGVVELRSPGRTEYCMLLGYAVYPAPETDASMFDRLLQAQYRFALAQSWTSMWADESDKLLGRKSNQLVTANDPAYEQKDQLAQARNDLQQHRFSLGQHHLTMAVFADDEKALDLAAQAADRDLRAACGATVSLIDWDTECAYFGMLSGTHALHRRAAPIQNRNFAAMAPLHGYPRGWRNGRWCDHLALFNTNGGTPYYWNPHTDSEGGPGESPNVLFTGPNRSGKTTLLQSLLVNALDPADATVLHWGKDRDAFLLALLMDGPFFDFRIGEPTGLAPLKALDADDPADIDHLNATVRALMQRSNPAPLSDETIRRIDLGLRQIMRAPRRLRSFRELSAFLDADAERLRPWCHGEELGWVLDCEEDRIALRGKLNVFDQTAYLDHALAAGPMQHYLLYRGRKLADGRRLIISMDEAWKALGSADNSFRDLVFDALKAFPKREAALWLSMQLVADALRIEGVGPTLRTQCLTHFHFPDGSASWDDYGPNGLGVTERAFGWITKGLIGGGRGRFLLKQGARHTPLQYSLEGEHLDDVRAELSARTTTLNLMDELIAEMGTDDKSRLLYEFHRRRKLPQFLRASGGPRQFADHDSHAP